MSTEESSKRRRLEEEINQITNIDLARDLPLASTESANENNSSIHSRQVMRLQADESPVILQETQSGRPEFGPVLKEESPVFLQETRSGQPEYGPVLKEESPELGSVPPPEASTNVPGTPIRETVPQLQGSRGTLKKPMQRSYSMYSSTNVPDSTSSKKKGRPRKFRRGGRPSVMSQENQSSPSVHFELALQQDDRDESPMVVVRSSSTQRDRVINVSPSPEPEKALEIISPAPRTPSPTPVQEQESPQAHSPQISRPTGQRLSAEPPVGPLTASEQKRKHTAIMDRIFPAGYDGSRRDQDVAQNVFTTSSESDDAEELASESEHDHESTRSSPTTSRPPARFVSRTPSPVQSDSNDDESAVPQSRSPSQRGSSQEPSENRSSGSGTSSEEDPNSDREDEEGAYKIKEAKAASSDNGTSSEEDSDSEGDNGEGTHKAEEIKVTSPPAPSMELLSSPPASYGTVVPETQLSPARASQPLFQKPAAVPRFKRLFPSLKDELNRARTAPPPVPAAKKLDLKKDGLEQLLSSMGHDSGSEEESSSNSSSDEEASKVGLCSVA